MTTMIRNTRVQVFEPDVLPPFPQGLYQHVNWVQDGDGHFLIDDGVVFKPINFGFDQQFGVYEAGWCEEPTNPLVGERPDLSDLDDDPFVHESVWASDRNECGDLTAESRQEVRDRALHAFLRLETIAAEKQFADRLLADAGAPVAATNLKDAIGKLTDAAALAGIGGVYIHGRPYWALQEYGLFTADLKTTLGATLVLGGGYVETLENKLVATTPVYGWRTTPDQQEAVEHRHNEIYSLAQRSVMLGYEKIIGIVEIS